MRIFPLVVSLAAAAACGELTGGSGASSSGSAPGDAAAPDAVATLDGSAADTGVDAGRCPPGAPFVNVTTVPVDGAHSIEGARFSADRLSAYLSLCSPDGSKSTCDLYQSSFTDAGFGKFGRLDLVSSAVYDSYPTVTPDETWMLFGSGRSGGVHVFASQYSGGAFQPPTQVPYPGSDSNEPWILPDGQTVYAGVFSSNVWRIRKSKGAPPDFGAASAVEVAGLADTGDDFAPVVTGDEEEIFFASSRGDPTAPAEASLDVYVARHQSAGYGSVTRLQLGTANGNDYPVWISPDACDLYYVSKDPVVATLYVAHRR